MKTKIFLFLFFLCTTCFAQYEKDSLVKKGDTTYFYFKNGCLHDKGIWQNGKWVGGHTIYYEKFCGKKWKEVVLDKDGVFLAETVFDENGKFSSKRKAMKNFQPAVELKPEETDAELLEKAYGKAIFSGDSCFKLKDNVNARSFYQKASQLKPEQPYPKGQSAICDKYLNDNKKKKSTGNKKASH